MMMRTAADEAHTPKYSHVERERRWVTHLASLQDLARASGVLIEDRYITGTRLRLRRMVDARSNAEALKVTKKYESADPLARPIVTTYLTDSEYELLAALPAKLLVKRRYPFEVDGLVFSIDCFEGTLEGLALAEIEMSDEHQLRQLVPPPWAVRDVSTDVRYDGATLAARGLPED